MTPFADRFGRPSAEVRRQLRPWIVPILVALGCGFGVVRVFMAALTTHNGINVLVTLPHATMPASSDGWSAGAKRFISTVLAIDGPRCGFRT